MLGLLVRTEVSDGSCVCICVYMCVYAWWGGGRERCELWVVGARGRT